MKYAIAIAAVAATAFAQETTTVEVPATSVTSVPYTNGFTSYLSMTNSLGVVTGIPSVITSQPTPAGGVVAASSAAGEVASGSDSASGIDTTLVVVSTTSDSSEATGTSDSSETSETSDSTVTETSAEESASESGADSGSATESSSAEESGNAAAFVQPVMGLGAAAAIFAAFL